MPLFSAKKGRDEDQARPEIPALPNAAGENDSAGGDPPGPWQQLTQRLGEARQLLDQANEQVTTYLIRSLQPAGGAGGGGGNDAATAVLAEKIDSLAEKLDRLAAAGPPRETPDEPSAPTAAGVDAVLVALLPLQEKLTGIESRLKSLEERTAAAALDALTPALLQVRDAINQQVGALSGGLQQLQQRLDAGLEEIAEQLAPPEPEESPEFAATPVTSSQWQRAIFGDELSERPGLDFQRHQLINGVLEGDAGACSLVGQLLIFRSALTKDMPPLLKDVGEAYYRWQPKTGTGAGAMEEALVSWLRETCDDAGISNTIELVHPGERFDSTRHSASTRGVEITEVRGWIVLRDNGKVYAKATVAVR